MHLRRPLALATCVIALAAPTLTSCGFDYATDRVYTPADGVNHRDGEVDVLGAVVVSATAGEGTFIATFSNNSTSEPATFSELTGTEGPESLTVGEFSPIEIPAGGLVNLAEPPAAIKLTGDFQAGDFLDLAVGFENGERAVMEVPVVPDDDHHDGLDQPAAPTDTTETTEPTDAATEG